MAHHKDVKKMSSLSLPLTTAQAPFPLAQAPFPLAQAPFPLAQAPFPPPLPPTSSFTMGDTDEFFMFENLDPESLLNNARITWSKDSIRTIRAFCAKHRISDRNRPTPTLLLELLKELKALKHLIDAGRDSFLNATTKLLTCIRTNVSLHKDMHALSEEPLANGTYRCVWYAFSKSWFAPGGWDGDISPPEPGDAAENWIERPVVPQRQAGVGYAKLGQQAWIEAEEMGKKAGAPTTPAAQKQVVKVATPNSASIDQNFMDPQVMMNQAMNQALIKAMFEEMARLKAEHFVNSTNQALPSPSPSPFTNPTLTPVRPSDKEAGNEQAKVTTPEVSTDGSEMVEVEKIVDERDEDVKVEYRIRWKGFGESDDTWETLEDFENMDEVLEEWEQVKHKRSRIQAKPVEATSKAAGDLITQEGFMKWAMQALMSQKKAQLEAAKNDSTPPPTPQNRTKDSFDGVATGSKQQTSKKKVAEAPNAAADVSTPKKNNPKAAPDTTLAPTTPKAPERRRVRERQVQGTAVTTPASALRTPELRRVRGVQAQKTDATAPGSAHKVPDICKALGAQAEEKASPLVKHNKGKAVETEIQPVQAGANVNDEDFDDEWFGGEM